MSTLLLLGAFLAIVRAAGPITRLTLMLGTISVLVFPFLLSYRPFGGFVIGALALIVVLYLGNQAIFNIAIGLTAVLKEVGQPRRLALLAPIVVLLGLITGDLRDLGAAAVDSGNASRQSDTPLRPVVRHLGHRARGGSGGTLRRRSRCDVGIRGVCVHGMVGGRGLPVCRGLSCVVGLIVRAYRSHRGKRSSIRADKTPRDGSLAILWTVRNPIASPALLAGPAEATRRYLEFWDEVIVPNNFRSTQLLLTANGLPLSRNLVGAALEFTFEVESRRCRSLFGDEAIVIEDEPLTEVQERLRQAVNESGESLNLLCTVKTQEDAELLRLGLRLQRYLVTRLPIEASGCYTPLKESQRDTMWFTIDLAYALQAAGLSCAAVLLLQSNKGVNRRKRPR